MLSCVTYTIPSLKGSQTAYISEKFFVYTFMVMMALILLLLIYDGVQACRNYIKKKTNKQEKKVKKDDVLNATKEKSLNDSTFL